MAEIISTEDVHLYYGKKEALHGISMNFHENEITALIGPSGCGKSTYLRCINRMKDDLHKSALAFSGGQQQRICIARVLAVHPKVILMDEPTSALDPISSSKIEDTLLKLKNDYSIIIVTHNMQQASRISDRTALLLNGDLIEDDRTEEMFLRPKEKITDDYLNGRFG